MAKLKADPATIAGNDTIAAANDETYSWTDTVDEVDIHNETGGDVHYRPGQIACAVTNSHGVLHHGDSVTIKRVMEKITLYSVQAAVVKGGGNINLWINGFNTRA